MPPRSTAAPRSSRTRPAFGVEFDRGAGPPAVACRAAARRAARTSGRSRPRRARAARSGRSGRRCRRGREARAAAPRRAGGRRPSIPRRRRSGGRGRSAGRSERAPARRPPPRPGPRRAHAGRGGRRPAPAVTAAAQVVPTARNVERSSRAVIARLPTWRSSRAWRRARPVGRRRAAACRCAPLTTSVCAAACGGDGADGPMRPGEHGDDGEHRPDGEDDGPDALHQSPSSQFCVGARL